MIRLSIFAALALAIMTGVWNTFVDPTPENASKILQPTPEDIAEAQGIVQPVLEWIFNLTKVEVVQLGKDAAADIRQSLQEDGGGSESGAPAPAPAPAPAAGTAQEEQGDPGIDWYRGG